MFIPIRNNQQGDLFPLVTIGLIGCNLMLFAGFSELVLGAADYDLRRQEFGLIPSVVMSGQHQYSFLTAMFLHDGVLHLVPNLLFLWIFGATLEQGLGAWRFLLIYLAAGFVASSTHVLSAAESTIPLVGASGAIAGIMGASLLLHPRAGIDMLNPLGIILPRFVIPAWLLLLVWLGLQVLSDWMEPVPGSGGIAYWAHVGGFVAGVVFALPHWLLQGDAERDHQDWQPLPSPDIRALRKARSPEDSSA